MNRLSLLLIDGTQVGPFVQQQLHHLRDTSSGLSGACPSILLPQRNSKREDDVWVLTSWNPLWAAWCRAVLPVRSAMFRLLRWVSRASAQRVARLAAATCSGVCQNLSRALASAPRLSSSPTALWSKRKQQKSSDASKTPAVCQHNMLAQSINCSQASLAGTTGCFCLDRRFLQVFWVSKLKQCICLLHSWMQLLCATGSTTHDL